MSDEPQLNRDNPFESPKSVGGQPRSGSPTLRIVMLIILSTATALALPIVFLTVCVAVAVGGSSGGVNGPIAIAVGVLLATLAISLILFGMIRLCIWLLKPRQPIESG